MTDEGTIRRATQSVPGVAGYELRLFDIGALFRRGDDTEGAGTGMLIEGVPAGSRFYVPPLIAGRWLGASDQAEIVVHKAFADEHWVALGDGVKTDLGALAIGVIERGKEIGVLRAVGANSSRIAGLFTAEALIQGVLSWVIAAPLSLLIAERLVRQLSQIMLKMDLTVAYSTAAAGIWLVIVRSLRWLRPSSRRATPTASACAPAWTTHLSARPSARVARRRARAQAQRSSSPEPAPESR